MSTDANRTEMTTDANRKDKMADKNRTEMIEKTSDGSTDIKDKMTEKTSDGSTDMKSNISRGQSSLGSILLGRLGWQPGTGLGKDSQGNVQALGSLTSVAMIQSNVTSSLGRKNKQSEQVQQHHGIGAKQAKEEGAVKAFEPWWEDVYSNALGKTVNIVGADGNVSDGMKGEETRSSKDREKGRDRKDKSSKQRQKDKKRHSSKKRSDKDTKDPIMNSSK